MVAINPRQQKAIMGAAQAGKGGLAAPRNRIATYADDAAIGMDQMYADLASEMRGAKQAQPGVNRIAGRLSPTVDETALIKQRQQQAEAVAELAEEAAQVQRSNKIVGYTDTALQVAGFAPLIVGGAQMLTNGVRSAGSALGGLVGLNAGQKAASAVPARDWNSITFSEIGEATGTKNLVGSVVQGGANLVATPVDWLARKTGLSNWRSGVNTARAAENLAAAQKTGLNALTASGASLSVSEQTLLSQLHSNVAGASSAGQLATTEMKQLIANAKNGELAGKLSDTGAQFLTSVEDSVMHHESAAGWSNVKGAVQDSPKSMGQGSASHGIMNAAFIGMSALSMFGDARTFAQNLESLRQMYADITGEDAKKVSTIKLLTGSVPEPVAEARSHLIKQFGVKQLFDIGNIALQVAMLTNRKFGSSWKSIGAMMGASMASSAVDSIMGESILPIHKAFSDAHRTGQHIPPEFYAAYLYAASKDLRSRGEKGQEFAMEVGQQYAAERLSPGQVLNEISNGKLLERIQAISGKYDQAQAAPAQMGTDMGEQQATARVTNREERPVVGKFTQRLNQEAQLAGMGQGLL